MESLELLDCRDFPAPRIFEQVAAMNNLKEVRFSFKCRSPSEAACKAALPRMSKLEIATFSDGRPQHTREEREEGFNEFARELVAKRKAKEDD